MPRSPLRVVPAVRRCGTSNRNADFVSALLPHCRHACADAAPLRVRDRIACAHRRRQKPSNSLTVTFFDRHKDAADRVGDSIARSRRDRGNRAVKTLRGGRGGPKRARKGECRIVLSRLSIERMEACGGRSDSHRQPLAEAPRAIHARSRTRSGRCIRRRGSDAERHREVGRARQLSALDPRSKSSSSPAARPYFESRWRRLRYLMPSSSAARFRTPPARSSAASSMSFS